MVYSEKYHEHMDGENMDLKLTKEMASWSLHCLLTNRFYQTKKVVSGLPPHMISSVASNW